MSRPVLKRLIPAVLVLGLLAGTWVLHKRHASEDGAGLRLFGNVDIRQAQLAFQDTGRIVRLHAKEGDAVSAGQLLAELDPVRYAAGVARAEAQCAMQQEIVARLEAGSRPEEIAEAQARVRAAEAALKDAEQRHARLAQLGQREYISRQQLDDATVAVDTTRANLDAVRKSAELVTLGPRREDIAAAQAQLKANQAALDLARQELADTRLTAPGAGVIQNRILEIGDMAAPQAPVYTLSLTDPVWVRAYVSEADLGKIALGMPATVNTDSFPGKDYAGWVGYISPSSEFTPKQIETPDLRTRLVYQVRIFVANPANQLRLGMPATVHITPSAAPHHEPATPDASRKD